MKKSAFLGLMLAIALPICGYMFVKYYSKDAVHMPRHYFYDSVSVKEHRGKTVPDTLWHQVKNIQFTNQWGKQVSLDDAKGKIIVMDFFFSRCPSICPNMTKAMRRVQQSFLKHPEMVQFISVSIDPEHDSVPHLRRFADRFNANLDNWWFVTGDKQEIYDFAIQEMKANIADTQVDTAFIHTENFFLLDTNRVVRGWYSAFDTTELATLARDIPTLMLEKTDKSPSVFRSFIPALPLIIIGIGIIIAVMTILNRKKDKLKTR